MIRPVSQFIYRTARLRECNFLCLTLALLSLPPNLSRAELASSKDYQQAIQVLTEGSPSLAAQKLEFLLNDDNPSLTGADKEKITLLLLESQIRCGNHQQALELFDRYPALQQLKDAQFWKAMALVESKQLDQAESILKQLSSDPESSYQNWITLTLARIQTKHEDLETTLVNLQPLLTSSDPETVSWAQLTGAEIYLQHDKALEAQALLNLHPIKGQAALNLHSFLLAQIALLQSDYTKAISYLEKLRKNEEPYARELHQKAALLLGDALLSDGQNEEAINHWLHLIKHHPDDSLLPLAFEKLAKSGAFTQAETARNLTQWSEEKNTHLDRQIYSQYYLALTSIGSGQALKAQQDLEAFLKAHPDHSLHTPAALALAGLLIIQDEAVQARSLLSKLKQAALSPENRSKRLHLEALADFKQGDFVKAEKSFLESSTASETPNASATGSFNVALTALYAGDEKTFTQYQRLLGQSENTDLQAELLLEQALYQASNSATQAFDTLSLFLEKHPQHLRVADAHFALAELYLNEIPSKPVSAREQLQLASEKQLSLQQKEALDYIAVWVEKIDGNHLAAIEQAQIYLDHWPQSRRAPEIRLKLGGAYYREKDFSQAVVALEQLAANHPQSSLYGAALFSAGKAASLSMQAEDRDRAIELWARLAKNIANPLSLYARHEQGLYKLKLDEFDDAITAFDSILNSDIAPPLELKLAVLADQGQAMFNAASSHADKTNLLVSALKSFDSILSEPKASQAWRNQAAVRKAKCLERLGRIDEALNTYTDVVKSDRLAEGTNSEATVAQMEWFFRAGLGAIRLLENKKEWHDAILIADSLANSGSSRAIEAARLADRIRLKHFIWDRPEK
ncbi:MAG: tetratricopeptide repeat protein [Verrucomicrobia bacterium]|nr:tetratricopeptide repeat protein [Verrucomicrobiota bacterium]